MLLYHSALAAVLMKEADCVHNGCVENSELPVIRRRRNACWSEVSCRAGGCDMYVGCFKDTAGAVFALSPNPKLDFETLVLEKRVVTQANMMQPLTDWSSMRLNRRFPEWPVNSGLDWKNGGQDLEEELAVYRKYAVFSQSAELM